MITLKMQDSEEIKSEADALRELFEKHLGVKAPTFERAVKRAGRRLPRGLRQQAARIVEAEAFSAHPKLAPRVDRAAFDRAARDLSLYLKSIDLAQQRKDRWLNLLAGVAFNMLIVLALFLAWLWWQNSV
jgi:hypothetical protein